MWRTTERPAAADDTKPTWSDGPHHGVPLQWDHPRLDPPYPLGRGIDMDISATFLGRDARRRYGNHAHRAVAVEVFRPWIYIAEQGTTSAVQRGNGMYELETWTKNIGHRVGIYESHDKPCKIPVGTFGGETPGEHPWQFNW